MIWVLGSVSSEHTTWRLLRDFVDILRLYARLLRVVADIEEVSGKSFGDIMKEGARRGAETCGFTRALKKASPRGFREFHNIASKAIGLGEESQESHEAFVE
jgi:hypothetical protein